MKPTKYTVTDASFKYHGCRYGGTGVLRWDPDDGFELDLAVKPKGKPPKNISMGTTGWITRDERQTLHMKLARNGTARLRDVVLRDRWDIARDHRLSARFRRLTFSFSPAQGLDRGVVVGKGTLSGYSGRPLLPEVIHEKKQIAGRRPSPSWRRSALVLSDPVGLMCHVELDETLDPAKKLLRIHWRLRPRYTRLGRWWRWPEALENALTVLMGSEIRFIEQEGENCHRLRHTLSQWREPQNLGAFRLIEGDFVDPELVSYLTRFFYKGSLEADVARRMLRQIEEAARQKTSAGAELLTATILEAALRTLRDERFEAGEPNRFKAKKALRWFQRKYLDDGWEAPTRAVFGAWRRLRHRNAHPDWLHGDGNDSIRRQAVEDLMTLTRFYGIMIFAMARVPTLPELRIPQI